MALPLASGVGLLVYLLAGVSLPVGVSAAAALGGLAFWLGVRRTPPAFRRRLARRARIGLVAGLVATLAYDAIRLAVVSLFDTAFWPFDVFSRFGVLLVGSHAPASVAVIAGTAYHYVNGIGFGVGFAVLFQRPGIATGLLWAAVLEILMVSVYPSWLDIRAWQEFVSISLLGHAAYGTVLGALAGRRLRAQEQP